METASFIIVNLKKCFNILHYQISSLLMMLVHSEKNAKLFCATIYPSYDKMHFVEVKNQKKILQETKKS